MHADAENSQQVKLGLLGIYGGQERMFVPIFLSTQLSFLLGKIIFL
jgi:hypothetical protein